MVAYNIVLVLSYFFFFFSPMPCLIWKQPQTLLSPFNSYIIFWLCLYIIHLDNSRNYSLHLWLNTVVLNLKFNIYQTTQSYKPFSYIPNISTYFWFLFNISEFCFKYVILFYIYSHIWHLCWFLLLHKTLFSCWAIYF